MGKKNKYAGCNNPIAMARAAGPAPVTGPTIRDYLGRDRPSLEEATDIIKAASNKKGSGALAAWEEEENDRYREELRKERVKRLGEASGSRSGSKSRDAKKKKKKKKVKRRRERSRSRSRSRSPHSPSDSDSELDRQHKKRKRKKHKKLKKRHHRRASTSSSSSLEETGSDSEMEVERDKRRGRKKEKEKERVGERRLKRKGDDGLMAETEGGATGTTNEHEPSSSVKV